MPLMNGQIWWGWWVGVWVILVLVEKGGFLYGAEADPGGLDLKGNGVKTSSSEISPTF